MFIVLLEYKCFLIKSDYLMVYEADLFTCAMSQSISLLAITTDLYVRRW